MNYIKFYITQINIDHFNISSHKSTELTNIDMKVETHFKPDKPNKQITCSLSICFKDQDKEFLSYAQTCLFQFDTEYWNSLNNEKKPAMVIPRSVLEKLTILTIGTARGILFCKSEPCPNGQFIMPPVNVEKLIIEDLFIE